MSAQKHFVGIGMMAMSAAAQDELVAPNLGSCLGISVYDPETKQGAMIHCLLPLSSTDPAKAKANPYHFVDAGVCAILREFATLGIDKRRLVISVAGGANINDPNNIFEIGKKNYTVLRKVLWKNNLLLRAEHVGEACSRTVSLNVETGSVTVKANGEVVDLVPPCASA